MWLTPPQNPYMPNYTGYLPYQSIMVKALIKSTYFTVYVEISNKTYTYLSMNIRTKSSNCDDAEHSSLSSCNTQ